jgi:hypothetical protein
LIHSKNVVINFKNTTFKLFRHATGAKKEHHKEVTRRPYPISWTGKYYMIYLFSGRLLLMVTAT